MRTGFWICFWSGFNNVSFLNQLALALFFFYKAPDSVPPHNRYLMGYSELLHGSRMICFPLNISEKLKNRRRRDLSSPSFLIWCKLSHFEERHQPFKQTGTKTIFSFGYQSSPWKGFGPSYRKNFVLVVIVEFNWLFFLNIVSFNFVQAQNNSPRFWKFRRINVYRPDVV